jgi:hypothetical protein
MRDAPARRCVQLSATVIGNHDGRIGETDMPLSPGRSICGGARMVGRYEPFG